MSFLPRVTEVTREFVSRQFDDLGPEACVVEITACLARENPQFLEMARKCASDLGDEPRIMEGFGMFYQLLILQSADATDDRLVHALPRVTVETRDALVREIDGNGSDAFTSRNRGFGTQQSRAYADGTWFRLAPGRLLALDARICPAL